MRKDSARRRKTKNFEKIIFLPLPQHYEKSPTNLMFIPPS